MATHGGCQQSHCHDNTWDGEEYISGWVAKEGERRTGGGQNEPKESQTSGFRGEKGEQTIPQFEIK